jgi:Zn-dependent M28 family amino/carboxypeptidase
MFKMPGPSYQGPLPRLSEQEMAVRDDLIIHLQYLTVTLGERNIWNLGHLNEAANDIASLFTKLNYQVSEQTYVVKKVNVRNVIAEARGTSHPDEIIVIGAHYDSVSDCPGADDNGSGVAAVLEIAKLLANVKFKRTVRFVAFVNEECPFFYTRNMGSLQYARLSKRNHENIIAMLSIESIGYYSDDKNSQQYPIPFGFFYPHTGNFIGFVGNIASRVLVKKVIDSFRSHTPFPSEGIATFSWLIGVGWSDHWAFWKQGYRALMVTDTALFRNPHYHLYSDTADTLDYERMARVVNGLAKVVLDLANE